EYEADDRGRSEDRDHDGLGDHLVALRLEDTIALVAEPVERQFEPTRGELLAEGRPYPGRSKRSEHMLPVEAVALEDEDVLHGDEVAFVATDLTDLRDLARAVLHALDIDNEVDRGSHLLADGAE